MNSSRPITRRGLLTAAAASFVCTALSGCTILRPPRVVRTKNIVSPISLDPAFGNYRMMYAAVEDQGYQLPAIPVEKMRSRQLRQIVPDPTGEYPGTVVVDTTNHFLYLVQEGGEAIRYGVGLGRAGFEWEGRAVIQRKKKWPTWTPPNDMISREPTLAQYSAKNGGMAPGPTNPLGARALYIFRNNKDTLYRVHGSPEWWSMGRSVSSGCVRMLNQDVIDLYDRIPDKTPIIVTSSVGTVRTAGNGIVRRDKRGS